MRKSKLVSLLLATVMLLSMASLTVTASAEGADAREEGIIPFTLGVIGENGEVGPFDGTGGYANPWDFDAECTGGTYLQWEAGREIKVVVRDGYKFIKWTSTDPATRETVDVPAEDLTEEHGLILSEKYRDKVLAPEFRTKIIPFTLGVIGENGEVGPFDGTGGYANPWDFDAECTGGTYLQWEAGREIKVVVRDGYEFIKWTSTDPTTGETVDVPVEDLTEEHGLILSEKYRDKVLMPVFERLPVMTEATVTFKVVNGTWDGTNKADKTVVVSLADGIGVLPENKIPTGMVPDEGYGEGAWGSDLNTEVTGDVEYTYTFDKLELKDADDANPNAPKTGDANSNAPKTGDANSNAPKTGDESNIALWTMLGILSIGGASALLLLKRKKSSAR